MENTTTQNVERYQVCHYKDCERITSHEMSILMFARSSFTATTFTAWPWTYQLHANECSYVRLLLHILDGIVLPGANARANSSPSCLLACGTTEKSLKLTNHQECSFYWTRTTRKLHIFVWLSIIWSAGSRRSWAKLNQVWLLLLKQHCWRYPTHFW